MAEYEPIGVTLSIFERLTDRSPMAKSESTRSRWSSVGELEASVMDHLRALLNVRQAEHSIDAIYPETSASVAAYGISDFSSMSLANDSHRKAIRRSIERAIRLFEPRLKKVQVSLAEWKPEHPGLRFRIAAVLSVDPVAEPVAFDAMLAKDSKRFQVMEAGN